jgi:glucokinase
VFPSRDHTGLDEIVAKFAVSAPAPISHACFGVPGPAEGERAVTTNLPWIVEAKPLETALDGAHVWLINDLEANAYGIAALGPGDLARISPGAPVPRGTRP